MGELATTFVNGTLDCHAPVGAAALLAAVTASGVARTIAIVAT